MTYAQDVFKDSYSVSQHISKKSQKCLLQEQVNKQMKVQITELQSLRSPWAVRENEDKIMQQLKTEKMTSKHFWDSYWLLEEMSEVVFNFFSGSNPDFFLLSGFEILRYAIVWFCAGRYHFLLSEDHILEYWWMKKCSVISNTWWQASLMETWN